MPRHDDIVREDYQRCTPFCNKLRSLGLEGGKLPTYSTLKSLVFAEDNHNFHQPLGTLFDLRKRPNCAFCQLVLAAILEEDDGIGNERRNSDALIEILLFPEEQSFRLSCPSRLGTRLSFVAEDDNQVSGPEAVRLVSTSAIQPSQILRWLQLCEENHAGACSIHNAEKVSNICTRDKYYSFTGFVDSSTRPNI